MRRPTRPGRRRAARGEGLGLALEPLPLGEQLARQRREWEQPLTGEAGEEEGFAFFGPTCDDMDYMEGPFQLPADVKAGDWIEIGMLGAYGAAMRTKFNGFGEGAAVEVTDEPMSSQYMGRRDTRQSDNVVRLR